MMTARNVRWSVSSRRSMECQSMRQVQCPSVSTEEASECIDVQIGGVFVFQVVDENIRAGDVPVSHGAVDGITYDRHIMMSTIAAQRCQSFVLKREGTMSGYQGFNGIGGVGKEHVVEHVNERVVEVPVPQRYGEDHRRRYEAGCGSR